MLDRAAQRSGSRKEACKCRPPSSVRLLSLPVGGRHVRRAMIVVIVPSPLNTGAYALATQVSGQHVRQAICTKQLVSVAAMSARCGRVEVCLLAPPRARGLVALCRRWSRLVVPPTHIVVCPVGGFLSACQPAGLRYTLLSIPTTTQLPAVLMDRASTSDRWPGRRKDGSRPSNLSRNPSQSAFASHYLPSYPSYPPHGRRPACLPTTP
ncbi:hypothetical protein HDK77DRAFT_180427 [Phyllosticta capitalensis]